MTTTARVFVPPFCPRSDCRFHRSAAGWVWIHYGTYIRRCRPQVIPRFRCVACGRTFSTQTFSSTYYLKRPELQIPFFHRVLACSGYRQIAREARCSPTTVMNQVIRLGRHALLYLTHHRPTGPVGEPIVIDGFESFAHSQFQPLHLNTAVGARSHYVYAFTQTTLRRKGRMTERQKMVRQQLEERHGRPEPGALRQGIEELIRIAVPEPQALTIRSDEHPTYPRAFRQLSHYAITHEPTSSRDARTPQNPLFAVNLLDLLLRHNSANHKRETIAFSKRHQSALERAAVLVLWRNFMKPVSETHDPDTPAIKLGLCTTPLAPEVMLDQRLFVTRVALPRRWRDYYQRAIATVGIQKPRRLALKRAA